MDIYCIHYITFRGKRENKMKKFRLFPLILLLCMAFTLLAPCAFAVDDPDIGAQRAVIADLDSGRILYSKNMDEKASPASLTKIMTVLLAVEALENGSHTADELVTAQADCRAGMDETSSTANIQPGEQMRYIDLLYCAMLASANEACNIIAACVDGSVSAFVEHMNQRAAELGCVNTHFANTNGLTDAQHHTTAYDLYLLTREAVKHQTFMDICNTKTYQVPATNSSAERNLANSNALICGDSIYGSEYLYQYAAGVKTGYTRDAGYCLISTAEKDGVHVMAVIMGCSGPLLDGTEKYYNFINSIKAYDWAFGNFSYQTAVSSEKSVMSVNVSMAEDGGSVMLRPQNDAELLLPNDTDLEAVELRTSVYEDKLVAPIDAGTVLGEAEIVIDGVSYGTVKLVNSSPVSMAKGEYIKSRLNETFGKTWVKVLIIVIVLFAVGYISLVMRYRRLRQKHLRERRLAEQRRRAEREQYYREHGYPVDHEPTQRFSSPDANGAPRSGRRRGK